MKNYPQNLKETAYHEAGHLVAAIIFKFNPKRATIIPNEDCDGYVIHDLMIQVFPDLCPWDVNEDKIKEVEELRKKGFVDEYDDKEKLQEVGHKLVITALAGYEAQLKFNPDADASGSRKDIVNACDVFDKCGFPREELDDKSINYPDNDKLQEKTKEFVEENWFWIEMGAYLLLLKKELNEDDIKPFSREILSPKE
jgi:hypothetical protein